MKKIVTTFVAVGTASALYLLLNQNSDTITPEAGPDSSERSSIGEASRATNLTSERDFDFLLTPDLRDEERFAKLDGIDPSSLTSEEISHLVELLAYEPASHRASAWNVIVNRVMNLLQHPSIDRSLFNEALLQLAKNEKTSPILRDYALQHLGSVLKNRSKISDTQFLEVKQVFLDLITDEDLQKTSIPGTALSVLAHYQRLQPDQEASRDHLSNESQLTTWMKESVTPQAQISHSLQASSIYAIGAFRLAELRPEVRDIALSESTDPSVRLTAIATLGQIGTNEDISFLQKISTSESRYRYAAQASLAALQN